MLTAFHGPDDVHAFGLGLPLICVLQLKLDPIAQPSRFRLFVCHPGLNWANRHANHIAIELISQPEGGASEAAANIQHASASAAREPVRPGAPLIGPGLGQQIDQHPNIRDEDVLPRRAGIRTITGRNVCECGRSQHGILEMLSYRLAHS